MRIFLLLTLTAFIALSVAFLYHPKDQRRGRFYNLRRRIRIVSYAYVAAVIIRLILYQFAHFDF
jgi:hypothetical protein